MLVADLKSLQILPTSDKLESATFESKGPTDPASTNLLILEYLSKELLLNHPI
jgi:hypothetical protein